MDSPLSFEFMDLMNKITLYKVRVLDEKLRDQIAEVQGYGTSIILAKQEDQFNKANDKFGPSFYKASERLGILLREIY